MTPLVRSTRPGTVACQEELHSYQHHTAAREFRER